VLRVFSEDIVRILPSRVVTVRPTDLSVYGLDSPAKLSVVADDGDWSGTLLIGNRSAEHEGRYVMIEGHDAVLLETFGEYTFLNTRYAQLRSGLIWFHNIGDVSSLVFDLDGEIHTLRMEHGADESLRGWLDGVEISDANARELFMTALMISQSGETDAPVPAGAPAYAITMNMTNGNTETVELHQLNDSQFLIVHNGYSTELFVTRMSLQENLLSRLETLGIGG